MNDDLLKNLHTRILAGDSDAWPDFEAAMRPFVIGYLIGRLRLDEADADEIWNDAFLEAVDRAATVEPLGTGLRSLVLTVARNKGVDRIRRAAARPTVPIGGMQEDSMAREIVIDARKAERVRRCTEAAPPGFTAVMEMTARGLPASEMATVLGKSEQAVAKMRSRARAWFRECLKGILDE